VLDAKKQEGEKEKENEKDAQKKEAEKENGENVFLPLSRAGDCALGTRFLLLVRA
jgi:hypothetical protein